MHFSCSLKNAEEVTGAKLTKSVLAQSENLLLVTIDTASILLSLHTRKYLFFQKKSIFHFGFTGCNKKNGHPTTEGNVSFPKPPLVITDVCLLQ